MCDFCDSPNTFDTLDGQELCETCYTRAVAAAWDEVTVDALEIAARRNGWDCQQTSLASTGSRYFTLSREVGDDEEIVTVRVSDHGQSDLRDHADFSVSQDGSDHTIEQVIERLEREVA